MFYKLAIEGCTIEDAEVLVKIAAALAEQGAVKPSTSVTTIYTTTTPPDTLAEAIKAVEKPKAPKATRAKAEAPVAPAPEAPEVPAPEAPADGKTLDDLKALVVSKHAAGELEITQCVNIIEGVCGVRRVADVPAEHVAACYAAIEAV